MKYGQPDSFRLIQLIANGTLLSPGLKTNATKAMQDCMKASMEVTDTIASIVTDDNDLNSSKTLNHYLCLLNSLIIDLGVCARGSELHDLFNDEQEIFHW